MDCVYVCRAGNNEELRYSIRSIVKNLPHANIWLVGGKPEWYNGNFIEAKDYGRKFQNIKNCLRVVADSPDISERFILMNDDFFITKKMNSLPIMHGGSLFMKTHEYKMLDPRSEYVKLLELTYRELVRLGVESPIDYDIHVPMVMDKTNLKSILEYEGFPRSMYGNIVGIGGDKIRDVKTYAKGPLISRSYKFDDNSEFISSEGTSFKLNLKDKLQTMFPEKTKYEI